MAIVSSVEPESTNTNSSAQATLGRVRRRLAASLQARMAMESFMGSVTDSLEMGRMGSGYVLFNQPFEQWTKGLAGLGQYEAVCCQVQLETGAPCRNPDLLHGRIGRDHKFTGGFFKDDVGGASLLFHFKLAIVFGGVEFLL